MVISSVLVRDLVGTWTASAQWALAVGSPCAGMNPGRCCLWQSHGEMSQRQNLVIFEQGGRPILTEALPDTDTVSNSSWVKNAFLFPAVTNWKVSTSKRLETAVLNVSEDAGGAVHLGTEEGCLVVEFASCSNRLTLSYRMLYRRPVSNFPSSHIYEYDFLACAHMSRGNAPAGNCTSGMLPDPLPNEELDVWMSFSLERNNRRSGCAQHEVRSNGYQNVQMRPQSEWWHQDWLLMLLAGIGLVLATLCACAVVFARRCRRHAGSPPAEYDTDDDSISPDDCLDLSEDGFDSDNMVAFVRQGREEHWLLKPQAVTLDSENGGAVQSKQRGFLNGTTEAWVKTVGEGYAIDDFLVEVRMLRHARHANVVAFYGSTFKPGNIMMLVLEWVPGSNLEDYVKRRRNDGTFSDELRLMTNNACCQIDECRLLLDVVRGMQYLHSLKPAIAHRALKPSSVLVDEGRTPCIAKLSDFSRSALVRPPNSAQESRTESVAPHAEVEDNQLKRDVFDFGLVALFAATSEIGEPSSLGDYLQKARQLGEGEIGGLTHIILLAESCLSDACPSFTEVFFSLGQHLVENDGKALGNEAAAGRV